MAYEGLQNSEQFQIVYKSGRRYDGRLMSVFVVPNDRAHDRFGITASRKAARRAVDRNRMKRLLREAIRAVAAEHLIEQTLHLDWVLNARRALLVVKTPEVRQELERIAIKAVREQCERRADENLK